MNPQVKHPPAAPMFWRNDDGGEWAVSIDGWLDTFDDRDEAVEAFNEAQRAWAESQS